MSPRNHLCKLLSAELGIYNNDDLQKIEFPKIKSRVINEGWDLVCYN